jgi:hypothetical protein
MGALRGRVGRRMLRLSGGAGFIFSSHREKLIASRRCANGFGFLRGGRADDKKPSLDENEADPGYAQGSRIEAPAPAGVVLAHSHARNKAQAAPTRNDIFQLRSENTIVNNSTGNPLRDNRRVAKLVP